MQQPAAARAAWTAYLAQAPGAFYGGALLTGAALAVALWMRRLPVLETKWQS